MIVSNKSFSEKVWAVTAKIPPGRVATYGDIAGRLANKDSAPAYRAVGMALHRNPRAPVVPCHRVVGSDGRLTGYAGGLAKKKRMLEAEGVAVVDGRVDLSAYRWQNRR